MTKLKVLCKCACSHEKLKASLSMCYMLVCQKINIKLSRRLASTTRAKCCTNQVSKTDVNKYTNPGSSGLFLVSRSSIFPRFHDVRGSLLDSAPRARFWCPGAPFFHAFQVGFLGPPNTPLETLESVEMVEATCSAKRPAFEGRWFFLWACRGCNNAIFFWQVRASSAAAAALGPN